MMIATRAILRVLALVCYCGAQLAAPTTTTTTTTTTTLDVQFASSDGSSYAVLVDGRPWFKSGGLRFFAHGEWHGTTTTPPLPPPPPPLVCAAQPNSDVGSLDSVTRLFPNATIASCCEACKVEPADGCNAWVMSTAAHAGIDLNTCFLLRGARGYKPSNTRTAQVLKPLDPHPPFPVTGTIHPVGATHGTATHGTDRFGSYNRVSFNWLATSAKGSKTSFTTAVRKYSDNATVVFEQSVPDGATHTNHKNVTFADSARGAQHATTEPQPFLHFPSFNLATEPSASVFGGEAGRAGVVTWTGTFVHLSSHAGPPVAHDLGLSSGPVVVYEGFENGGENSAVIISPATHFKGATMNLWADDWVVGMSGEITEVPPGFVHETVLHASRGVTSTVAGFGHKMQAAHNTSKRDDIAVNKVGYWTDNGAYYYGDAYPQHHDRLHNPADYNLSCCTKNKLVAAKHALDADKVPIRYMQLDDWWYHGPHPARNFSGVKCVSQWELPSDTYPGGLTGLRETYGAPFLLYGPYFCHKNQWNQTLVPKGADAGVPPPEQSEAFYTKVFEYAHAHGGIGYEVDFMSNLFIGIPEFRRTLDASTEWQHGMNAAGLTTDTTIQWCMMQPSDLLNTLNFDAVTNGRASGDYAGDNNWNVGGASLLFWAVGLRPSKDNFWSGDGQARQVGFTQTNPGTNGELNAIIATMSTGPVGPSDGAGQHNATRLMRTCSADGTILQPEQPLIPIDASYREVLSGQERQLQSLAVWSTRSQSASTSSSGANVPRQQYHLLAVNVSTDTEGQGAAIFASDLSIVPGADDGDTTPRFAVRDWHRAARCIAGADAIASRCVRLSYGHDSDPLVVLDAGISWPFGTKTMQLYTVTPLDENNGFTLLGELDKFVPLSSKRFSNVSVLPQLGSVHATLHGQAGEVVHVTALKPERDSFTVVTVDVTIGPNGTFAGDLIFGA